MNRRTVLIAASIVAALALLGWFSLSQSDKTTGSSSTDAMPAMTTSSDQADHGMPAESMDHSGATSGTKPLVAGANGTRSSAAGLTLRADRATLEPARPVDVQLRVLDRRGTAVTKFERDQTKLMHLIVVRSDLTDYQHLHPALGSGGVFTIKMQLPRPGAYRAIADFTTGDRRYALAVRLRAPGGGTQAPLPPASTTAATDGFGVETTHDEPSAGSETAFRFTIRRDGRPVKALLPYLGAYGHLVALRRKDIAYSHVHPLAADRAKGTIAFATEFASPGAYRLFLQFRTASGIHTAPFTIGVS